MGFTKFINHTLHIYVFELDYICIIVCQGEIKIVLIADIDDQNITCVLASKAMYLNLRSSIPSKCLTYSNHALQK